MEKHIRKPNRLKGYDYSTPGAYFVTICVQGRHNVLGKIVGDGSPVPGNKQIGVSLSEFGGIVHDYIKRISEKYPDVLVDEYVIMPNHIHMLIGLTGKPTGCAGGTGNPSPTTSLGNVIGWLKYQTTKSINEFCQEQGHRFWQRSYHDHIIRTRPEYEQIRQYIVSNPELWEQDCFYDPDAL